ncbi:MAG: 1-acyl-sn-glycerol-3-phosphate acyltransferase [Chloroflexota bacterium]|nr:1-acyl-sn-glycerol-3-phosphate acyltransferase [Chloroflexota bacterium]
MRRKVELTVEGLENLPTTGGVLIAARHYHHLWDGAALFATIERPASIIVGLDWVRSTPLKAGLMAACRAAGWPVVARSNPVRPVPDAEARALLVRATRDTLDLLRSGQVVIVFPEGYPNIDPGQTRKSGADDWLPFEPGVVRLAQIAARQSVPAPIVPVGFSYMPGNRWAVTMRIGEPLAVDARTDPADLLARIESAVRELSGSPQAANTSAPTTTLGAAAGS